MIVDPRLDVAWHRVGVQVIVILQHTSSSISWMRLHILLLLIRESSIAVWVSLCMLTLLWLDVPERMKFKLVSMVHNCLHHKAPRQTTAFQAPMWPVDGIFILLGIITSTQSELVWVSGILLLPAQLPGTHWAMICVIWRLALTVSDVCLKLGCFQSTSANSAIEVSHFMCCINSRLTYSQHTASVITAWTSYRILQWYSELCHWMTSCDLTQSELIAVPWRCWAGVTANCQCLIFVLCNVSYSTTCHGQRRLSVLLIQAVHHRSTM